MPESDSGDQHIARLEPHDSHKKGCVTKHDGSAPRKKAQPTCCYRGQGYANTKGDPAKRALYEIDFTLDANAKRLPFLYQELKLGHSPTGAGAYRYAKNPTTQKTAWHFVGNNFITAYLPYNHNYHHILPFDALKPLEYEELELLQEAGYNLNAGNNMIILPCHTEYGYALKLPAHPTDHPKYTRSIRKLIARIKQSLSKNKKKHQIKKGNAKNFKDEIESWQQAQFWKLVQYGGTGNRGRKRADVNNAPLARRRTLRKTR